MLKQHSKLFHYGILVFDLAIGLISFALAYFILSEFAITNVKSLHPISAYAWVMLAIFFFQPGIFIQQRLYDSQRLSTIGQEIVKILKASARLFVALSVLSFIFKQHYVNPGLLILFSILNVINISLLRISIRILLRNLRKRGRNFRDFLIVGTGTQAKEVLKLVEEFKFWGIKIAGLLSSNGEVLEPEFQKYKILGNIFDLPKVIYSRSIDGVIFALPLAQVTELEEDFMLCEKVGVNVYLFSDFLRRKVAKTYFEDFSGVPFLSFSTIPQNFSTLMVKRIIDVFVSSALLIILSPLLVVVALMIKLTSRGPIFFKQLRVGLYGRKFTLLKFRTMFKDAEEKRHLLLDRNILKGPIFKIKDDPRITRVGRIIRKFSIDELPQLLNVLRGDMSLVGPRPPIPDEVEKYESFQRRRLSMKPGMTCIWQVNGRNKIGFDDWVKLDLYYIDNWSLGLDFKILAKTVPVVLMGVGAY